MPQQFARPQPSWIEIRQIAARSFVDSGISNLLCSQNLIDVEPGTR